MGSRKVSTQTVLCLMYFIAMNKGLKLSSLDITYKKGMDAYAGERWSECIAQFEGALHLYKLYKSVINNCRNLCSSQVPTLDINEDMEDLSIYEKFFVKRECLLKCHNEKFAGVQLSSEIHESTLFKMKLRKPYEYLHICYFNMYSLPKAASAAYTYLVANPSDEHMQNNLQYYAEQPEVDVNEIMDLESEEYEVLYRLGLKSYNNRNWRETIASFEEALLNYMTWENMCRNECERQPEQEWSPELAITMSNIIASLLQCRQQCQTNLKHLSYNSGFEFLADVLNYLQISYYRLDKFKEAAEAVAGYLSLMPGDEDMLENKYIYSTLTENNAIEVKSEIDFYKKRDMYEKKLINFFHQDHINSNKSI